MRICSQFWLFGCILIAICTLTGCKGTNGVVREVPVYIHDTLQVKSVQKDSVFVHDSVYVYRNGDTLYITKWLTKSMTKIQHDTIREVQEIPVEVVRTEVKEVENPLKWWQKTLQFLGLLVVIAGQGFALSWYVNRKGK